MVLANRNKPKTYDSNEEPSEQQTFNHIKQRFFNISYAHLRENEDASFYPYYCLLLLEHLSLLWFVIHPNLNVFDSVYLLPQLQSALQMINFYEYMSTDSSIYITMMLVVLFYLVLQMVLLLVSIYAITRSYQSTVYEYLRKIVNYQLLFNVKVLCGPVLGLVANVIYCVSSSPYHNNQVCYSPVHLTFCIIAVIIALLFLAQVALFSTIYYIRNPLTKSCLGQRNRFFTLSKTLIKIVLPVYFALDYTRSLSLVYIFAVALVWCLYIFFHRILSTHTYEQQHFYVQFFMQGVVCWLSLNNILSYYLQGPNDPSALSLVYALVSALLAGLLLVNFQKTFENRFVEECLEDRIKKQNMQRFMYILVHKFVLASEREANLSFRIYSKLLRRHMASPPLPESPQSQQKQEIYSFLCQLLEEYLHENGSIILKTLKCYLLCLMGQKSYGLHQSLELEEQRLSVVDEFMLFQFRKTENIFGQQINSQSSDFVRFYRFHEELGKLQQLLQACTLNNLEYWQELSEGEPSLAKSHNLATNYTRFLDKIQKRYARVVAIFPQNVYASSLQLNFYLNVAVDVREALKMKQKLMSILQNEANTHKSSEVDQDQNVSIVTLDSIGSNLGVVLNCNNHLRQLLGFDRQSIMGKNITKLMPKIYTELHNDFMLKFIQDASSHLRPSNKKVATLNVDSLLVEIKLTVRIMDSAENALIVVGFMRRIPSEPQKGLLMFQGITGEMLGVDQYFLQLMNYRLSGKQIVAEGLRISSLIPEANIDILENEGKQNTILEVGAYKESDGGEVEMTKKVIIELRESKMYQGRKICFVTVAQNLQISSKSKVKSKKIIHEFCVWKPKAQTRIQGTEEISRILGTQYVKVSVQTKTAQQLIRNNDGLSHDLPMVRRYEEYIKSQEENSHDLLIKSANLLCLLACTVLALYIYLSHNSYLTDMQSIYDQMGSISNFSFYQAQINLYTEQLWSIQNKVYQQDYTHYFKELDTYLRLLQATLYDLITSEGNYAQVLQYNSNNFYYCLAEGQTLIIKQITLINRNAIANYISAASVLLEFVPSNSSLPNDQIVERSALFVRLNGQKIIPSITYTALNSYSNLVQQITSSELMRIIKLNCVLVALSILCLLIAVFLGNYLNKTNQQVVELYQQIRLWDISELLNKCNRFLQIKGVKPTKKRRRNTSLINMLPIKDMLDIAEPKKFQDGTQPQLVDKPLLFSNLNSQKIYQQNATPAHLLSPAEPVHFDRQDASLKEVALAQPQMKVRLRCQFSNKPIIIGILVILAVVIGLISLECVRVDSGQSQLTLYIRRLLSISQTRKSISFLNYFANRLLNDPQDSTARLLLTQQINLFYNLTKQSYEYLGDPNNLLKQVYTVVESLQQGFTLPNISLTSLLVSNQTAINRILQRVSDGIANLDRSTFRPQYQNAVGFCSQTLLIFTMTLMGMGFLVVLTIDCMYMQPIRKRCVHSINMLKMIPAWVLQRNQKAASMLTL